MHVGLLGAGRRKKYKSGLTKGVDVSRVTTLRVQVGGFAIKINKGTVATGRRGDVKLKTHRLRLPFFIGLQICFHLKNFTLKQEIELFLGSIESDTLLILDHLLHIALVFLFSLYIKAVVQCRYGLFQ